MATALNENGKKVEEELNRAGFSLAQCGVSIGSLIDLGLVDRIKPLTGKELLSALEPKAGQ